MITWEDFPPCFRCQRIANQWFDGEGARNRQCAEDCGRLVGADGYAGRCHDCAIRIQNEQQEGE